MAILDFQYTFLALLPRTLVRWCTRVEDPERASRMHLCDTRVLSTAVRYMYSTYTLVQLYTRVCRDCILEYYPLRGRLLHIIGKNCMTWALHELIFKLTSRARAPHDICFILKHPRHN